MVASRSSSSPSRAPARRCSRPRSPSAPAGCGQRPLPRSLTKLKKPPTPRARTRRRQLRPPPNVVLDELEYLAPHDRDNGLSSKSSLSATNAKPDLHDEPPDSASRPTRSPTQARQRSSTRIATEAHSIDTGSESWRVRHGLDGENQQEKHHRPGFTRRARVLPTSTAIPQRQPRTTTDANRGQFMPSLRIASTSRIRAPRQATTRA